MDRKAAEAIFIAARVLNDYQSGFVQQSIRYIEELHALAQNDEERTLPLNELAGLVITRFSPRLKINIK